MKSISLTGWQLAGFWPYVPLLGKSVENGMELSGVTEWIEASVPGSVQADLQRAGIIKDPYFGCNSLACEWVSNRWWMYKCRFHIGEMDQGEKWEIVFGGIDYRARVYLNGHSLGIHTGMYQSAVMEATGNLLNGYNDLVVLLEHAPDEMSQIGYTSSTCTQKARFGYKWDFGTRLVHLGLYEEVVVRTRGRYRLDDVRIIGGPIEASIEQIPVDSCVSLVNADVSRERVSSGTCDCRVTVVWILTAECADSVDLRMTLLQESTVLKETCERHALLAGENRIERHLLLPDAALWYPNGHGAHPLCDLQLTCTDADRHEETRSFRIGLRSLSYRRNEGAPMDSLPYTILVNGKPIYLKGVNLVPLDHMYGAVSDERYEQMVRMMADAHVNLVRVWGGGLIEKQYFYDLCDEYGILVWQEFIQSSSGLDNTPSTEPDFLELLAKTAESAVKERRNHVCLTCWSGGNELMEDERTPVRLTHPNIHLLEGIVSRLDPGRLFLPSSASGPLEFLDPDRPGENHDVHGPWKYGGTTGHYSLYNRSDSLLHSEFGVDGMASVASLAEFLAPEDLTVTDMKRNLAWRHHGEWWDTLARDSAIFGAFTDLHSFVRCSQVVQAEGIRYAIESNRRRAFANCGSILWQFNEPWPNVSCTSVVEWSGRPKAAYHAMRCAFRPRMLSLRYEQWTWSSGELFSANVFLHNEGTQLSGIIECEIRTDEGLLLLQRQAVCQAPENSVSEAFRFSLPVPEGSIGLYVTLVLRIRNGNESVSRYNFPICDSSGFCSQDFSLREMQDELGQWDR